MTLNLQEYPMMIFNNQSNIKTPQCFEIVYFRFSPLIYARDTNELLNQANMYMKMK